jgi:hydroxypyruvate isomerase
MSRRGALAGIAASVAGATIGQAASRKAVAAESGERAAIKGRINHSVAQWCFAEHWDIEQLCTRAEIVGCKALDLVSPADWPTLKRHRLTCGIAPNGMPQPPFIKGFNNPIFHDEIIQRTKETIDDCADFGCRNVIAFTGFKWSDPEDSKSGAIAPDEGIKNSVAGFKRLIGYAENKGVTVCLEILNTRASDHPMKGHPGYQGDHVDYCLEIIRRVGSPNLKLLFDVYHVQIMDGDLVRRIRDCGKWIGHVHTAGNPGRGELDEKQEINYAAVMQALLDVGYKGYVGHEFIPTRDPAAGLRQAVLACDV